MDQILFHIPILNLPIYGYGLMMVMGFFGGIQLCIYLARRCGLDPDTFMNAGLLALGSGILGARVSHVIENFGQYTDPHRTAFANLKDAVNISSGGLTYYGGFLLALPTLVIYAIKKGVPVRLGMDIIAPGLMIALGFGRIGCLLNGCCYGAIVTNASTPTITFPYESIPYQDQVYRGQVEVPAELLKPESESPEAMSWTQIRDSQSLLSLAHRSRSLPMIPAQIYSTITAWLIAAMVTAFFTLPHAPGRAFALMMIFEGLTRFLLEILRAEPPVMHIAGHGWSLSMFIGAALFAFGIALWFVFGTVKSRGDVYASLPQFAALTVG